MSLYQRPLRLRLLGLIALAGISCNGYAQSQQSGYFARAGLSLQSFHYQETNDRNEVLDREDGLLPGLELQLGKRWDRYTGIIAASILNGAIDYEGQTQRGSALLTNTDEYVRDVAVLLKRKTGRGADSVQISAGLGHRQWRRDIRPTHTTSRLLEIYRWSYGILGIGTEILQNDTWTLSLDWRLLRPIQPAIEIHAKGFDPLTLDLGSNYSVHLSFPLEFCIGHGQTIVVIPSWQSWYLKRSKSARLYANGIPSIYSAQEPDSETHIFGISVSLRLAP
jgi:hypothetical protein